MKYKVEITAIKKYSHWFEVEADSASSAIDEALVEAWDYDFDYREKIDEDFDVCEKSVILIPDPTN